MIYSDNIVYLKKLLFLILFFNVDGFAFRYPMNAFFDKPLKEVDILDYWKWYNKNNNSSLQLYFHNMYCITKCSYCNCHSWVAYKKESILEYYNYLLSEIKKYWNIITKPINSIYIWWWTFNLLEDEFIENYCKSIIENFTLSKNCIWQVEIHPYYLTENTLNILKKYWVTDIMIWIQSISEKVNKLNNRKFSKEKLDNIIKKLKEIKFRKVSFDLIYDIPYMTETDLINDLEYVWNIWKDLKNLWINVNVEINRWDISTKPTFVNLLLKKWWKNNFFDICKFYFKNSKIMSSIVDKYIDKYFLNVFDTDREEIEERRALNTAILWIWVTATSYIPWVIAYENNSFWTWKEKNTYLWYKLNNLDNDLFLISHNLRRWINKKSFKDTINNNEKFKSFCEYYKKYFIENKNWDFFMNVQTDIENDLLNIFLIDDEIREEKFKELEKKWQNLWFTLEDLEKYYNIFLEYYYNRNKLYG